MPIDVTTFKTKYTEFADIQDEVVASTLEEQKVFVNESKMGSKYPILLFLLVAHELALLSDESDGSVEVSRSINGGSRTVKNIATNAKELYYSKTKYGLNYLAKRSTVRFAGAVLCDYQEN